MARQAKHQARAALQHPSTHRAGEKPRNAVVQHGAPKKPAPPEPRARVQRSTTGPDRGKEEGPRHSPEPIGGSPSLPGGASEERRQAGEREVAEGGSGLEFAAAATAVQRHGLEPM